MKIKHFFELTRVNHGLIVAFAILVGSILTVEKIPNITTLLTAALCGICIQAGSFAIGDYFDLKTDRANKRYDRPLTRGDIKTKKA